MIEVNPSLTDLERFIHQIAESSGRKESTLAKALMQQVKFLTEAEQSFVLGKLRELRTKGTFGTLDDIKQIDYKKTPVSIEEFLDNPYYLGKSLIKKDGTPVLFPKWREELVYVCDKNSQIIEWVFTGAIGVGKTFTAMIAQLYKGPYHLSCLRNPQEFYDIEESSRITFGLFNANLSNAASVDFARMMNFIDNCKYFKENCPRVPVQGYIYFPTIKVAIVEGSKALHTMGTDMFGYVMDEANFMQEKGNAADKSTIVEEQGQAYQLYHHAVRRMESRFLSYGTIPGLACLVSSRKHKTSFLEKHMEENKNNPKLHVSDYSLWEVKGRHKYSKTTFRVSIGDKYRQTELLDKLDPVSYEKLESKDPDPGCQIIEIPADFYKAFEKDPNGALRDIAGYPTTAMSPLIIRVQSVHECIRPGRFHPFLSQTHTLSMNDPASDLMQFMQWGKITTMREGAPVPIMYPAEPRFIHVDLSLSGDKTGISMGCAYDKHTITAYDPLSAQPQETFLPKIWVDFMLRISPVLGEQIDITKIVAFILNLRNYGFPLQRVTFDGFQSAMAIQIIQKAGRLPQYRRYNNFSGILNLEANVLSVDRTEVPYTVLRDCLNYRCINYYKYEPFIDEVLSLEHDHEKRKVDHPERGSKDVSDAVAGMVYNIATSKSFIEMDPINEIMGHAPGNSLEEQLTRDLIPEYPEGNVIRIIPDPKQTQGPAPRRLSSGLVGLGNNGSGDS